jgi:hypothetical protein
MNIEDELVCVENLTGTNGIDPKVPISFIKKSRFIPRYYRLQAKAPSPAVAQPAEEVIEKPIITAYTPDDNSLDLSGVQAMPIVIRRVSSEDFQNNVLYKCEDHWPVKWQKIGSFIVADDETGMFEVMVRPDIMDVFQIWIKFNKVRVTEITHRGTVEEALDKAKSYLNRLVISASKFVCATERNN